MIRKQAQYDQVVSLRKRGFTYVEIAKIVEVSKSTVSAWISRETWSKEVQKDNQTRSRKENSKRISLLNKARSNQHAKLYAEAERSAVNEYRHYRKSPLFVAGVAIYLAAGDLQDSRLVRLSSNDPNLHKLFISFAYEYLGVPKTALRFWLLLYPEHDEVKCMKHWCKKARISPGQFYKTQYITSRSNKQTLHFGVGNTIIGSILLKKKLLRFVELIVKE